MDNLELQKLKYPIGTFKRPMSIDENKINNWIATIADFPEKIKTCEHHARIISHTSL